MLKPADVPKMLLKQDNPVNLILEQANLGRGKHWFVGSLPDGHCRPNLRF